MRRVVGLTLTGLGAFLLALALLQRFYLPNQVIKFPLNVYQVATLSGSNMTYFSPKNLTTLGGVTLQSTSTTDGDVAAGSSSTAVWQEFTALQDVSNNLAVSYTNQRLGFNRRTGVVINCCGAHVNNVTNLHLGGQAYVWPFNTQQKTYQVFDPTLLRPEPFAFTGTTSVDGTKVYRFVEHVANQQFGTEALPGALVGATCAAPVTLPEFLTETNIFLVDPVTGAPLSVTENQNVTLRDSTGVTRLVLLQGTLTTTPASVASLVSLNNSAHAKILLVQDVGPIVELLLGIVLIVVGIVMLANRHDDEELSYAHEEPETSTV